jgi:hypothetical protein
MLRLLTETPGAGYPGDYLRARIQGRRDVLSAAPGAIPAGMIAAERDDRPCWVQAATERSWLFRQLDLELRAALAPLFLFFELGTMATVLRYQAVGRLEDADRALEDSLLAPAVCSVLRGREGLAEILSRLERSPAGQELSLGGIRKSYSEGGLQRCEELLRRRFLAEVLARVRQQDMVFLFRAVVDIRNILALGKWLRWRPESLPALIPGGLVPLPGSVQKVTAEALARMVRRRTQGLDPGPDQLRPEQLESLLEAYLLRQVARRRRTGSVAAACIEYVWRGYVSARECSMRLHTAGEAGL